MKNRFLKFLAKTYKVWIVVVAAVVFFLGYNAYLVDYSLVNIKIVLDKAGDIKTIDDAKRLAKILDYSVLTEVSAPQLKAADVSKLELAKDILSGLEFSEDILSNVKDKEQIRDVKFLLEGVVAKKEQKRPVVMVALSNFIGRLFNPMGAKFSKAKLESEAKYLSKYIATLTDKIQIQRAYFELGTVYTKLKDFTKAREAFQEAAEVDPATGLAKKSLFNIAWNEKYRGNYEEALKQFDVLAKSEDKELSSYSEYQIADCFKKKGELEKAEGLFREIGRKYPREEFAQLATFQAGYINLYDLSDLEKAKKVFEEAKALFQDSAVVRQIEKVTFRNIGWEYLKKGYNSLREGRTLLSEPMFKEADKYFDKGLEVRADDGVAYVGKAIAYLWLKDEDKARTFAERAVKLSPRIEMVSVNAGYVYYHLKLPKEAIKECERYLSINRNSLLVNYNLGYVLTDENQTLKALLAFRRATKIDPDFAFAHNNLGWCYWKLRKYANALQEFRKAVKIKPQFERAQFNLGQVYMVLGSYGEAKKAFEKISETSPEYGQAIYNLRQIEKKTQPPPIGQTSVPAK